MEMEMSTQTIDQRRWFQSTPIYERQTARKAEASKGSHDERPMPLIDREKPIVSIKYEYSQIFAQQYRAKHSMPNKSNDI
jgi:hypothetical protein